jgi:hypothetical protein
MNDLAEKALRGLDVARRQVGDRPALSLSVVGFAVSCLVVVAGGQVSAIHATRPLINWFGLQDTHGADAGDALPGIVLFAGVVALVLLWLLAVKIVRRRLPSPNQVWLIGVAWGVPFAVGPPFMDSTVYSYAAFGLMQRQGRNPYEHGAAVLGGRSVVAAIDPGARGAPSGVGPLGTLTQHLAVSIGSGGTLGAVIALRVVGVLAAIAIGRLAVQLAGAQPARALAMTVLNPLVLLYVVSAAHLDGVMVALVLGALVAANRRRWLWSVALACLAGAVTPQGYLAVPAIVVAHWLGRRRVAGWLIVGRDLAVAAATVLATGFAVNYGFGWVPAVSKQFSAHTPFAIASGLAKMMAPIVRGASYDDLAAGARITTVTATVCAIVYLLVTSRQRALERTVGYSLLALALLAPVLYPWYLLWGTMCLAPAAAGSRRIVVIGFCAAGCVLDVPGFSPMTSHIVTAVALTVVAALTGVALTRHRTDAPGSAVNAGG